MAGQIVEGRKLKDEWTLSPDFCIVGSGAAGGVCALKLAEAGFNVVRANLVMRPFVFG